MLFLHLILILYKIIKLSNNSAAYWGKKTTGGFGFGKTSLKTATNHLIGNCYVSVGNVTMKQAIGIPKGVFFAPC